MPSPGKSSGSGDLRAVKKRLADGSVKTYYYPRISPERDGLYIKGSLGALIVAYKTSPEWDAKAKVTKGNYTLYLKDIETIHQVPVKELKRRQILTLRDSIAKRSGPAAATLFVRTVSAMLTWAVEREWVEFNAAAGIKALKGGHLKAWTAEQAKVAMAALPEPLRRVVVLGMFTGQRRGDLISLPWTAYDGTTIRLRQKKTGAEVILPVSSVLRAELDAWKREATSTLILTNFGGLPWDAGYLSHRLPMELAKIPGMPKGLNVHGLRKLAATILAEAGCSTHEIAAVTGHKTLSMVQLYTASVDKQRLAEAAIVRFEAKKTG